MKVKRCDLCGEPAIWQVTDLSTLESSVVCPSCIERLKKVVEKPQFEVGPVK